tara:strand:- start:3564 stop:4088 length:525 start_codon:yes stop_codon:yes gene_type:complete
MKTRMIISLALLSFLLGGCSYYQHLEDESEFNKSTKGSFIRVWVNLDENSFETKEYQGELIAVDSTQLYVIAVDTDVDSVCTALSKSNIESFNLYYAKPNTAFWSIPVFTGFTITHGVFLIATAPLNLLITSLTQGHALRASRSQESDLNLDELAPFARYPRGIPAGLTIEDIH